MSAGNHSGAGYMIGVDIGGTFTDCVVVDASGAVVTGKAPTTPADRSAGFFDSIERAGEQLGMPLEDLLRQCRRLVHGTTTGTNAIVQRAGACVGLLATSGHEDVMFVMKGMGRTAGLPSDQALDVPNTNKPAPLVPRQLVAPITERIDVDGDIVVPLDEQGVHDAVRRLCADGIDALAIAFLWSTVNPVHERLARDIARSVDGDLFVSCSSDLTAKTGEYERTTTAVMNSYIGPLMLDYVDRIQAGASEQGFTGVVQFAQCAGGSITIDEARRAPIRTVQSGPVAGTIATQMIAERCMLDDIIAVDMGGTTFDVSVIHAGRPLQRDISVFERYAMALPMLDIESIGAGGGSIAWVDEQQRLNVGPQSAGARPGPACYGLGGTAPTVTDADVVLGLIEPDNYLGGKMALDRDRAEAVIGELAEELGLGLVETAAGITRVVDARMADLVRRMSLLRGLDPRRFTCAAFGGGGPLHGPAVARQAGIRSLLIPLPRAASVWSAFGAATSDVTHVFQNWRVLELPTSGAEVQAIFDELERDAMQALSAEGLDPDGVTVARSSRMRFSMQIHDVEVPVGPGTIDDARIDELDESFGVIHEQLFGRDSGYRSGGVQFTAFQVRVTAGTTRPDLALASSNGHATARRRSIYWPGLSEHVDTPVYRSVPSHPISGPALIELPDTVIAVPPGHSGLRDELGNFLIEIVDA